MVEPEGALLPGKARSDDRPTFAARLLPAKTSGQSGQYEVSGGADQYVYIELKKGDRAVAAPGAMLFMAPTLEMSLDCSSMLGRCCSGEACCLTAFEPVASDGSRPAYVAFTPYAPAIVVPLELERVGHMHVKRGAFMAGVNDVTVDFTCDCNPATCCCSGMGCVRQRLEGTGVAFVQGTGTVMTKTLAEGEKFVLDTNTLLAWEPSTKLGVRPASLNPCVCCMWQQGCCNTTLEGPGTIYMQSKTVGQMQAYLRVPAPSRENGNRSSAETIDTAFE